MTESLFLKNDFAHTEALVQRKLSFVVLGSQAYNRASIRLLEEYLFNPR